MFSNVASKYDIMNDLMSLGIHRLWKQYLVEDIGILRPKLIYDQKMVVGKEDVKIIDVAAGTGDIGYAIIQNHLNHSSNPNLVSKEL